MKKLVPSERLRRELDEVLAGVSHDLAGPLARIRLYAEMIETESPNLEPIATAAQLRAWSARIIAATSTMKATVPAASVVAAKCTARARMIGSVTTVSGSSRAGASL